MRSKLVFFSLVFALESWAGVSFEPYYQVSSTKSLTANQKKGTEKETTKQREEKGLMAGLKMFRLLSLRASVGQSFLVTTTTESEVVKDEYQEIDFEKEIDTTKKVEGADTKTKETQNNGSVSFSFDPSFWIFLMRFNAGVKASQRIVEVYSGDQLVSKINPPVTYKPTAGAGVGVRLSSRTFFMVNYSFYFFKFPDQTPLERAMSVSFGLSI